jgi:hypothetical protein
VNDGKLHLTRQGFLLGLGLTLTLRLGLAKISVEFFLEFVVELNLKYLATFPFDLVGGLAIQAV